MFSLCHVHCEYFNNKNVSLNRGKDTRELYNTQENINCETAVSRGRKYGKIGSCFMQKYKLYKATNIALAAAAR